MSDRCQMQHALSALVGGNFRVNTKILLLNTIDLTVGPRRTTLLNFQGIGRAWKRVCIEEATQSEGPSHSRLALLGQRPRCIRRHFSMEMVHVSSSKSTAISHFNRGTRVFYQDSNSDRPPPNTTAIFPGWAIQSRPIDA